MRADVQQILDRLSREEARQLSKRDYVRALGAVSESEPILAVLPVTFHGARGPLVVTDRQLAFISAAGERFSAPVADVHATRFTRLSFLSRKGIEMHIQVGSGDVVFGSSMAREESATWFLAALDRARSGALAHASAAPAESPPPATGSSVADELSKLAELPDRGPLTAHEFATQKAQLLGTEPSASPLSVGWSAEGVPAQRVLARYDHGNELVAHEEGDKWATRLVWGDGAPDHAMNSYSSWNELVLREAEESLRTGPVWVCEELAAMRRSFQEAEGP